MTVITFFEENGKTVKVSAHGHSGFVTDGYDPVCAAVSTLLQTAYLAIAEISTAEYERDDGTADFEFTVGADAKNRHDVDVIIRAMTVGLEDLRSGFPQNIKLEVK